MEGGGNMGTMPPFVGKWIKRKGVNLVKRKKTKDRRIKRRSFFSLGFSSISFPNITARGIIVSRNL